MAGGNDHDRTMAFAGIAFEKIRALRHDATPHNYEIWYNYAVATNTLLNQAINELMAARGTITQRDLDELYDKFFSPTRLTDQIDGVSAQFLGEIEEMLDVVDGTLDTTSRNTLSLADMTAKIDNANDAGALCSIIARLVQTAKDIQRTNQKFEIHLRESKEEIGELQKHLEAVRSEILTDPLTTLSNRKHFDQAIVKCVAEAGASNAPLALVMTDIDHFKLFNDMFGHLTGDQVLRLVALSVKHMVKGQAVAARYGGEEFAIILPNTVLHEAMTLAEHVRRTVMARELTKRSTGENLGHVTLSLGVAVLRPGDTPQSLIERADNCLYAAKRNGRNRVVCESDSDSGPMPAKVA
jgi:diguanylate cyclase